MNISNGIFALIAITQLAIIILDSIFMLSRCKKEGKIDGELHTVVKMLFSFSMIIIAFTFWQLNESQIFNRYLLLIFIGMTFSAIGDMAMAKLIRAKDRLIMGMSFFSLAHVFYVLSYIQITKKLDYSFNKLTIIFPIGCIVSLCIWKFFVYNKDKSFKFNCVSLIYSMVISTMAFLALNLAIESKGEFLVLAIGAVIFMISDFIISISEIKERGPKNQSIWVWITYVIAQICIIYNYLLVR